MSQPNGSARPRRRLPTWLFYVLVLVATLAFGVFAGATHGILSEADEARFRPWFAVITILFAGTIAIWAWRRIDEAAREAHKWAWYWGGSAGLTVILLLMLMPDEGAQLAATAGFENSFADGIVVALMLQVIGYLIAWGYWWLRRR